jgi:peptidoglycan/xylan/chitin deacetylase (PgdA/CDA1 family)
VLLILTVPAVISAQQLFRDDLWSLEEEEELSLLASSAPPLLPLERAVWKRSATCPILYAHEVGSRPAFRSFLLGMRSYGYKPIKLATLDMALSGLIDLPRGCLVITFDDALYSQYQNALPVLDELDEVATFFVMPNFSDGVHRYMREPELRELVRAGQEVMPHTCNHATLPTLLRRNRMAFLAEIVDCRAAVESITGQAAPYLAYPNGGWDNLVAAEVEAAGYRAAFTTRRSATLSPTNPYALPRILFSPSESAATVVSRIREAGG